MMKANLLFKFRFSTGKTRLAQPCLTPVDAGALVTVVTVVTRGRPCQRVQLGFDVYAVVT